MSQTDCQQPDRKSYERSVGDYTFHVRPAFNDHSETPDRLIFAMRGSQMVPEGELVNVVIKALGRVPTIEGRGLLRISSSDLETLFTKLDKDTPAAARAGGAAIG